MKPLNYSDPGCNPVSSNCVIWQGPDIPCINLCKGDSISEVINKLAIELCNIMDMMNVTNYDLECLNLSGCGPSNFQQLIQVLINQICILQTGSSSSTSRSTSSTSSCDSCIVPIAACFNYTNKLGDTVTEMPITDYAIAIGNRICSIVTQITTINNTLASFNIRITTLENAPTPTLTLPQVTPECVLPSVPTDMDIVLDALESQFCQLRDTTGNPIELFGGISSQCITGSDNKLATSGTMSTLSGWVNTPTKVSDSLINLWLTLCDVRAAVKNIQLNCCPTGCDGVEVNVFMDVTGGGSYILLSFTGTIPPGFVPCGGGSTLFTISDGINTSTVNVDFVPYMNTLGYSFPFPVGLNPSANLTVSATICMYDPSTGTTCSSCVSYTYVNTASCPMLSLTQDTMVPLNIDWSFTPSISSVYTVELYSNTDVFISSISLPGTISIPLSGSLTAPDYGTYKVRVKFGTTTVTCPFESIELIAPIIT